MKVAFLVATVGALCLVASEKTQSPAKCIIPFCPKTTGNSTVCYGTRNKHQLFASGCAFIGAQCTNPKKYKDYKQLPLETCTTSPPKSQSSFICPDFDLQLCYGYGNKRQIFMNSCYFRRARDRQPKKYKKFMRIPKKYCIPPSQRPSAVPPPTCGMICPALDKQLCYGNKKNVKTFQNECYFARNKACHPKKYKNYVYLYDGPCL